MTDTLRWLRELIAIDSPTGFTKQAAQYTHEVLTQIGYEPEFTNKGAVRCTLGKGEPKLSIAAHLDTLGGIVEELCNNGTLRISMIGSYPPNSFEGCYVRVHTHEQKVYTGSLLLDNPSAHANKEVGKTERSLRSMHVRIDEQVSSKDDILALGIRGGDFVCFEPHYQELPSGYIKSRFMDNKAGCFVLFELAAKLKQLGKEFPVELYFSNYEEVGHGGAGGYSPTIQELLVIDMGVVGEGVSGSECAVSICAKDSSGPYDYEMRSTLRRLAEEKKIPC
ncbi:MAG: hypothetical protein KDD62_06775, partial [Bdellovibrionales bacterium]|nr:hypothetical protein [Bdellovibrionales bacterium]